MQATELKIKLMSFKAAADDWAQQCAEEKKKWSTWYASPEEKKKEAQAEAQKTKVHQGWKEMERKEEARRAKEKETAKKTVDEKAPRGKSSSKKSPVKGPIRTSPAPPKQIQWQKRGQPNQQWFLPPSKCLSGVDAQSKTMTNFDEKPAQKEAEHEQYDFDLELVELCTSAASEEKEGRRQKEAAPQSQKKEKGHPQEQRSSTTQSR